MKSEEVLKQLSIAKSGYEDLHILRLFSSFVAISRRRIIAMTEPRLEYCPLLSSLYPGIHQTSAPEETKETIKRIIGAKISEFGHFTDKRDLLKQNIAVPYGASEILMYALRKKVIDAAVVVCDGAGTVITGDPDVVQGIGARMNGLFYTSAIERVTGRLRRMGCRVPFAETADIDQIRGLEEAARLGYKKIALTINACMDDLSRVGEIENKYGTTVISLVVCTTSIDEERLTIVGKYADLVWSCASAGVRKLGERAILQLSTAIPVFVFTEKGLELAAAYGNGNLIGKLDTKKQHLVSGICRGQSIRMGDFAAYLSDQKLPVRSAREPRPLT